MFGDSFDSWAGVIALVMVVLIAKWLLVGIGRLFQRYNTSLVIFYLVLLTPTALTHSFLLGILGSSSEELREQAIQEAVEFQLAVEQEREKRS